MQRVVNLYVFEKVLFGTGAYTSNLSESTDYIWLIIHDLNTGHMIAL